MFYFIVRFFELVTKEVLEKHGNVRVNYDEVVRELGWMSRYTDQYGDDYVSFLKHYLFVDMAFGIRYDLHISLGDFHKIIELSPNRLTHKLLG